MVRLEAVRHLSSRVGGCCFGVVCYWRYTTSLTVTVMLEWTQSSGQNFVTPGAPQARPGPIIVSALTRHAFDAADGARLATFPLLFHPRAKDRV